MAEHEAESVRDDQRFPMLRFAAHHQAEDEEHANEGQEAHDEGLHERDHPDAGGVE
ncbi:hypothetical protein GCM10009823_19490 [Brevibacterium salitolerans]|uniref:Uncharacterized protein n=1 Tax=Brevibacterium salitolerans TaxID=1403566 RepID=A0ABN2WT55_9MICO